MKTYHVHFSFYSEENGNFDESSYAVSAENLFEARRIAWTLRDKDDDSRFQSCVKQCGVTWDASPLDLQDYFNAQAALTKCRISYIKYVALKNAEIRNDEEAKNREESDRAYYIGCLDAINTIARDIGKPFDMIPPTAFEEIEYAWQLVGKLDEAGRNDEAWELAKRIDEAKKWDANEVQTIRDLFIKGAVYLKEDWVSFHEHFGRDGVFPEKADINEREYTYIKRWDGAPSVGRLSVLPPFDERHVINGSADMMAYNYRTLVLRKDEPDIDHPETLLWTPCEDADDIGSDYSRPFSVENLITGERAELCRDNFHGVLRPEFTENIDFEALKKEYAASNEKQPDWWDEPEDEDTDEDDWEQGDD